jgi:hypothetical protein
MDFRFLIQIPFLDIIKIQLIMFIKYNFSKIKNKILILLIFQIIAEIKKKKI